MRNEKPKTEMMEKEHFTNVTFGKQKCVENSEMKEMFGGDSRYHPRSTEHFVFASSAFVERCKTTGTKLFRCLKSYRRANTTAGTKRATE